MFGTLDHLIGYLLLLGSFATALYAWGHSDGVRETEQRWSDAVGHSDAHQREQCARNGCTHA